MPRSSGSTTTTGNAKETEILDVGQELIQTVGYEGFSYRDIAERVGIRSATIHYYFPAKADLVLAVARRYRAEFAGSLSALDTDEDLSAYQRIERFNGIFKDTLRGGRVCLCGMLASGTDSLPQPANEEARSFFDDQEAWLGDMLEAGAKDGTISPRADPGRFARTFLAALEGAMMLAHNAKNPAHFDDVSDELLHSLRP